MWLRFHAGGATQGQFGQTEQQVPVEPLAENTAAPVGCSHGSWDVPRDGSARLAAGPRRARGCCRERLRQLPALPSVLSTLLPVLLLPTSHHLRDLVISQRSQNPSKQLSELLHNLVLTAGTRWGQCQVSSPTPGRAGTAAPMS